MIKQEKGITLVTLIITIILMIIITSTVVYTSLERFEINTSNKMINDLELLNDKVSNYYKKYGILPVLNKYTLPINFNRDVGDNNNSDYYIINLAAMEDISLNYGKEGYDNPNTSNDVYIISKVTNIIYYPKGVELKGKKYYYINKQGELKDDVPPANPEIKIISGHKNDKELYITAVEVEIVAGKDNWSGISKTNYSIVNGEEYQTKEFEGSNKIISLDSNGEYIITAYSIDEEGNGSSYVTSEKIEVHIEHEWDDGEVIEEGNCKTYELIRYTCTNQKCGATKEEKSTILGDHQFEDGDIILEPTCTTSGKRERKCAICGLKSAAITTIAPLGHKDPGGSLVVIKAATCQSTGLQGRYCTRVINGVQCKGVAYSKPLEGKHNMTGTISVYKNRAVHIKVICCSYKCGYVEIYEEWHSGKVSDRYVGGVRTNNQMMCDSTCYVDDYNAQTAFSITDEYDYDSSLEDGKKYSAEEYSEWYEEKYNTTITLRNEKYNPMGTWSTIYNSNIYKSINASDQKGKSRIVEHIKKYIKSSS